ncbi:methyltransferase type 12 [Caballeronia hypogeia]|uniref:Methyltransferase type 12 n=1 Tax=Caballeronia hypogeia TaxID=1777140 RepID=A0A158CEU1_9BURK|nr:methyltransferase domain-containing protein [Caballeronia hypogeia]SAK80800.1 methyltransferase type 12 [Caballeronia hypogeia]
MPFLDVYGRTHQLDAQTIGVIATRLEARANSMRYMDMLRGYLEAIDLAAANDVLALGCGTGVEVRELVRQPRFKGRVTAVDISPTLIEAGQRVAAQEGLQDRIAWRVDDAQDPSLPDAAFDLVIAHTLLSHVPEPDKVIRHAARVVKPGGTVAVFDGDYGTLTFGADRDMDEKIIAALIANPRILRRMPRLLKDAELELIDSRGWALTEIGRADFFLGGLQSFSALLPKTGVATQEQVDTFVANRLRASEEGTFFGGYNFYAMIARKPR